jgi:hypothetical protein
MALVILSMASSPCAAQEGNLKDSPLFTGVKDPKVVASQVRAALPAYEQGLALLNGPHDPDTTASAVKYLLDAYRYLRGAWEGTNLILVTSKFPDPLLELQNKQIMAVRWRLIECTSKREYLAENDGIRVACIEGLTDGLHKLRTVSATLP